MASAMHLPLLLLCLLVSHSHGSSTFNLRSIDNSNSPASATSCPSTPTGPSSGNKLPVVHRLSTCSPLGGANKNRPGKASLDEILHRDGLRLRYLSSVHRSSAGPSATKESSDDDLSYPTRQNIVDDVPGVYEYTVIAGYGTPAQHLPWAFDASGMSKLRCKPCFPSGKSCGKKKAFDPTKSSTFHKVPCDSPKCKEGCSGSNSGSCEFTLQSSNNVYGNGTIVEDTFTISTSLRVEAFTVGCLQMDKFADGEVAAGNIDLGLSRNSLVTRLIPFLPKGTVPFSYCLPEDTDAHGFLSIAPAMSDYKGISDVKIVPLVDHPTGPNFYFVDLVAITVNGKDLPFPASAYKGNGTMIDAQSQFSYLNPAIYAALRREFQKSMTLYPRAPAFSGLDTCYNVTEYTTITFPAMSLRFGNGLVMNLDVRQYIYIFREHKNQHFPFLCLAFAPAPDKQFPWNTLGVQIQRTQEVVYDVVGKKVTFVPSRCG